MEKWQLRTKTNLKLSISSSFESIFNLKKKYRGISIRKVVLRGHSIFTCSMSKVNVWEVFDCFRVFLVMLWVRKVQHTLLNCFSCLSCFAWMLLHSVRSTCSALLAFEKRRMLTAVGTQSNISSRDVARCSSICTLLPEVLGHLTWWTWMHLEISGGTRPTSLDNGLEPRVSVAWIKSEIFSHGFPALKCCWIMTLESSFVCLFLTRCIRGYCTLWDSYLFESSAWCHVLIRAQKLGKGLWLFSNLRSKRKNERGKGSALNPSLGWQRWFSRTTLEGTEQELGLCSCKKQINR